MKAITLHQPWASLVALGAKTIETRGWGTKYRGPLAIHAGMKGVQGEFDSFWCERDRSGYLLRGPIAWPYRLPLGAVVATCELLDVLPMVDNEAVCHVADPSDLPPHLLTEGLDDSMWIWDGSAAYSVEDQRPFGDFAPGRFAWILGDVKPIKQPTPQRGYQRLWNWDQAA